MNFMSKTGFIELLKVTTWAMALKQPKPLVSESKNIALEKKSPWRASANIVSNVNRSKTSIWPLET